MAEDSDDLTSLGIDTIVDNNNSCGEYPWNNMDLNSKICKRLPDLSKWSDMKPMFPLLLPVLAY